MVIKEQAASKVKSRTVKPRSRPHADKQTCPTVGGKFPVRDNAKDIKDTVSETYTVDKIDLKESRVALTLSRVTPLKEEASGPPAAVAGGKAPRRDKNLPAAYIVRYKDGYMSDDDRKRRMVECAERQWSVSLARVFPQLLTPKSSTATQTVNIDGRQDTADRNIFDLMYTVQRGIQADNNRGGPMEIDADPFGKSDKMIQATVISNDVAVQVTLERGHVITNDAGVQVTLERGHETRNDAAVQTLSDEGCEDDGGTCHAAQSGDGPIIVNAISVPTAQSADWPNIDLELWLRDHCASAIYPNREDLDFDSLFLDAFRTPKFVVLVGADYAIHLFQIKKTQYISGGKKRYHLEVYIRLPPHFTFPFMNSFLPEWFGFYRKRFTRLDEQCDLFTTTNIGISLLGRKGHVEGGFLDATDRYMTLFYFHADNFRRQGPTVHRHNQTTLTVADFVMLLTRYEDIWHKGHQPAILNRLTVYPESATRNGVYQLPHMVHGTGCWEARTPGMN